GQKPKASKRAAQRGGARMVDLSYALHDRAHVLCPGLFRSLAPGDRKRLKLDIIYNYGQDERLEFGGKEPLGVLEMRVLQGIVAMAGPEGLLLENEDEASPGARQLMLSLFEPSNAIIQAAKDRPTSLIVRDSLRRLAREIGLVESGNNLRNIRQAVERLFGVTVMVRKGGRSEGFRLLSSYASDEETGDLFVALSPRIASAILGRIPHARIDLIEARALESDPARLIHQRLSGWVDPGKGAEVGVDKLAEYVWPEEATEAQARWRRTKVRKAVAEIGAAGWRIEELRKDFWRFTRPRLPR
ncbi:replication protein C, IncQ-type, partial [Paracoccus fontiphilus]